MKTLRIIALFAAWMSVAAAVSLGFTMSSWGAHIEGKAFHCTDGDFPFFWDDMDTHKGAGDTLSPGWTWEMLKIVRFQQFRFCFGVFANSGPTSRRQ